MWYNTYNIIARVKFHCKHRISILETMSDSTVVAGSKIEGHTDKPNNKKDNDEATEKNTEGGKSTGKQGIEVELKKLEEEIKDEEEDSNPHVTKKETKGKMTSFCPISLTINVLIKRITLNVILRVIFISGKDYNEGSGLVCCKQDVEKCMVCSDSKIDGCLRTLSKRYSDCDGKI